MPIVLPFAFLFPFSSCNAVGTALPQECKEAPPAFIAYVERILTDSTGMFTHDYPPVTPLSCELLGMLQEELKEDSARYFFECFSRKHWNEEPHSHHTHAYIRRHLSFPLAMAASAHWFADTRIEGLRELQDYRRMRPMVCTTREGSAKLEKQDRAAVRYLLQVLETTPRGIAGSENSTIHDICIREVMKALDLLTRTEHALEGDQRMRVDMSQERFEQAMQDWRDWLGE